MVNRNKVLAAIDVGSSKVATIIAQVSLGENKINIIGAASVLSKGIRKGQIVDIEQAAETVVESVEAAERMAGISINRVLVSVGGAHISSQNSHGVVAIAEPEGEISGEDVRRVIEAARAVSLPSTREILHVIPRTYTVDSQEGVADPEGMSGVRLEVETHIITGASTSLKNLSKCVSEIGGAVDNLVFSGIASAEAVLTDTEKELGVVLADIGGGTVSLVIYTEGSPVYTSVLPIGAKNVTNDLAIGLRLSLESAEKLKLSLKNKETEEIQEKLSGGGEDGEKGEKKGVAKEGDEIDLSSLGIEDLKSVSRRTVIDGIIRPRMSEIFTMIGTEIQKSGFAGMTPSGVVLCGGGALTIGAVEICKKTLALPVRIGMPKQISGLIDDVASPLWATPAGLVLFALTGGKEYPGGFFAPKVGNFLGRFKFKVIFGKIVEMVKSFFP